MGQFTTLMFHLNKAHKNVHNFKHVSSSVDSNRATQVFKVKPVLKCIAGWGCGTIVLGNLQIMHTQPHGLHMVHVLKAFSVTMKSRELHKKSRSWITKLSYQGKVSAC